MAFVKWGTDNKAFCRIDRYNGSLYFSVGTNDIFTGANIIPKGQVELYCDLGTKRLGLVYSSVKIKYSRKVSVVKGTNSMYVAADVFLRDVGFAELIGGPQRYKVTLDELNKMVIVDLNKVVD